MTDINFSEILNNPHFNQFVSLLRVAMSLHWRMRHPEVPSVRGTVEYRLLKLSHNLSKDAPNIQQDFLIEWTGLFASIVEADPRLYYRTEDVDWLLSVITSEHADVTMSMLFAVASSKQNYLTPVQVAELTDTDDSGWRNKAAAGEIVGAIKAGKQWLLPVSSLRAYGTLKGEIPSSLTQEEPEEDEIEPEA